MVWGANESALRLHAAAAPSQTQSILITAFSIAKGAQSIYGAQVLSLVRRPLGSLFDISGHTHMNIPLRKGYDDVLLVELLVDSPIKFVHDFALKRRR